MALFTAIATSAVLVGAIGATGAAVVAGMVAGAVVGAVIGGVVAAVQGEDIFSGVLKGGLMGAAIGGALGFASTFAAGGVMAEGTAATTTGSLEAGTTAAQTGMLGAEAGTIAPGTSLGVDYSAATLAPGAVEGGASAAVEGAASAGVPTFTAEGVKTSSTVLTPDKLKVAGEAVKGAKEGSFLSGLSELDTMDKILVAKFGADAIGAFTAEEEFPDRPKVHGSGGEVGFAGGKVFDYSRDVAPQFDHTAFQRPQGGNSNANLYKKPARKKPGKVSKPSNQGAR